MKLLNKIILAGVTTGFIGGGVIPQALNPVEVQAASNITLSFSKINDGEGRINVTFGTGTTKVLTPQGTTITKSGNVTVKENKTYDFVSYDKNNRPTQHSIAVTSLNVDHAPLTTANGLTIKLSVNAFDTISEMSDYRYKLGSTTQWSAWKPHNANNSQEIKIPAPSNKSEFYDEKVQVQARDHAGNQHTVETVFRVDNHKPEVHPYTETIYTNKAKIRLPFIVDSYFERPQRLVITEKNKTTNYTLSNYKATETVLERRPDRFRLDYSGKIEYTVNTTFEGPRDLSYNAIKTHTDFKGEKRNLESTSDKPRNVNVIYDVTAPTGMIEIVTDEKGEVLSHEVDVNLTFHDKYGVKKVKVYEGNKEYNLTASEIEKEKFSLPWKLGLTNRTVWMEVTDNAGNVTNIESNAVIISNITITGFQLTDVVNPAVYADSFETRTWPYNPLAKGKEVYMLGGSNFDFKLYYDLGDVDPARYDVTGDYQIVIKDTKGTYTSKPISYDPNDAPSGEHFKADNPYGNRGFETTFRIPTEYEYLDNEGNKQMSLFSEEALVYIKSTLKRTEKSDGTVLDISFEDKNTIGNLIGTLGVRGSDDEFNSEDGFRAIDQMIRFNQKN